MPTGLAPLCPSCFERALAWTASSCPACHKSSPVAKCDRCTKSRAGAFEPDDGKGGKGGKGAKDAGGQQRFLCVDCMEELLEGDVSDRMRDSILAVILSAVAVRWAAQSAFIYALFLAAAGCIVFWWLSTSHRRAPSKHRRSIWSLFRRGIDRAVKRRARALS